MSTSKRARSHKDDHFNEFSSIPAHELLLQDQQMPDFDPTRGSILAFKEQIPERGSKESNNKDEKSTTDAVMSSIGTSASMNSNPINTTLELVKSAGENECTMENLVPKLVRENTMDLLSSISRQSQKIKSLIGSGKTEEPIKPPKEALNQTFEEPAHADPMQLNGTFDKDACAGSSNLNVTIEQPNLKAEVTSAVVLNGTFDQESPLLALNSNVTKEPLTKPSEMNGTFNHPEFKKYCNLDLTFDQPDLLKVKQEDNLKKTDVLNGTFDQPELKKYSNLDGTFVQAESSKQNQLNGTFDQPEAKNDVALNNTFDHNDTKKPVPAALNGTFDNPSTKMNETYDEVPKTTLDCTFEATETIPKGPVVTTGLDGTFDRGDPGAANTTFDYAISEIKAAAVLNDTFEQIEEKAVEDLNTTNLMDCGAEALQQFISLGTPTKGKMVASSTPKPTAKDGPVPSTQGAVNKDLKRSFLQRMSMGIIKHQEQQQQEDINEGEANINEPRTSTNLAVNGPKLADLSRESAVTTLRMKQKSLVERSSKAAMGPVKALPFLPSTQTDVEPQPNTIECDTMDVEPSGEAVSRDLRLTYAVPCNPSSPLGQFRKKHGISVGSSKGSVTDSILEEANKMAEDIGDAAGFQGTSISRLKMETTVDLPDGISVLKDVNSDGSTSDSDGRSILPDRKLKELQAIQNTQDFEGSDEVFIAPRDEVFAIPDDVENDGFSSSDDIESQHDTKEASTDSGKSDISVKSDYSVRQSKLGKPQMKAPQSLPKARTSLLPPGSKRASLQPKLKLQGPLGLSKKSANPEKKSAMAAPDATGNAINKAATLPAKLEGIKMNRVSLAPKKVSQPKNGKAESTLKQPVTANKPQSRISPPIQRKSLAPKVVAPKTSTVTTRQSLAPKAMSTRQSLAPKAMSTRQSLAPKTTTAAAVSRQSLPPKPASRQSLAPKNTAARQSLAPKSQVDKPHVNTRQSLAPKPVTAKPSGATTRQSLAPKPVTSSGLPKPSVKTLPKPSTSAKPAQNPLVSPKPVKSLQRPAPVSSNILPRNNDLQKSPSKQSPRKSNEENKAPEKKFGELKKPSGLMKPGLMKPQSRLPMKAGVLEDATNTNQSTAIINARETGLSRLALKQPGLGLNNPIDKKTVSKLVRKSSCLDTSLSSEKDVPVAKMPKLAKFSRESTSENLKMARKNAIPSGGSTSSVDSERPCTPDMANLPVDIYSGTPDVFRPGSDSMVTSTPAMASGYLVRLLNMNNMDEHMSLPTPIPATVSRLRFISDNTTTSSTE
ncbi:unnamed protein product [Meganyctiphanes norvegica]|uniref:Uncharacterized protein n=1 Tax=Meganyctiphanes norvegica TaxID=48144 RepID=A0AAV2R4T4_MEGNR